MTDLAATTSTQYSIALTVSLKNVPGVLGQLTTRWLSTVRALPTNKRSSMW